MAQEAAFVGVDWGTSNGRFLLVDQHGALKEQKSGPGIAQLANAEAIEQTCFEIIGEWLTTHPGIPVLMAGMVGSNIGWQAAGYVTTPADIAGLSANICRFRARDTDFLVVPGLSTVRPDGLPDVMRGEEVQIFGARTEDGLVCLPGTHSKWARLVGGKVTGFHTALTGELLDIVGRQSILLDPKRPVLAQPGPAFQDGVTAARDSAGGLESLLFTTRSHQITGTMAAEDADSYLAGLVIGCEIRSALRMTDATDNLNSGIDLIGAEKLIALYAAALSVFDIPCRRSDGHAASLAGLVKLFTAESRSAR